MSDNENNDEKVLPTTVISAKLPVELMQFIEDYRWNNRKIKSDIVIEALTEWATSRGYNGNITQKLVGT